LTRTGTAVARPYDPAVSGATAFVYSKGATFLKDKEREEEKRRQNNRKHRPCIREERRRDPEEKNISAI
jgi:hypothetical protein